MFSGIIEVAGTIVNAEPLENGRRVWIEAPGVSDGLADGDSVAVDGTCLTVVAREAGRFAVECIGTTLSRTTLGTYEVGHRVNLERALALGERLGGHLVQGHVDGVGQVTAIRRDGDHVLLDVSLPDVVKEVTVLHGSIAIQGISLTVNAMPEPGVAQVALIPYTWEVTNLRDLKVGDGVNVEGDMIGKFVVHYMEQRGAAAGERPGG